MILEFYIYLFCMAAPLQGSEESVGELVTRDGMDSPQIELKG